MEVNPLLSEDPFQSEQSQRLFEAIDEIRGCGVNRVEGDDAIGLPELVIVGDQSAGKSSLLQSLTDIPFPVASRLCTRFPTLIVSRRTPYKPEVTRISILPAEVDHFSSSPSEGRAERYAEFAREKTGITAADFVAVINEATDLMGLARTVTPKETQPSDDLTSPNLSHFSSDVLKIEISGPNRSHFSIVDVPGVFQTLTRNLKKKEMVGVRKMVSSYMKREQSIIICVANGQSDLATQTAFRMASELDRKGSRTVGVITKCDAAMKAEDVIELAQNREKPLDHGWFVVRNRTPSEAEQGIGPLERHEKEQDFFDNGPWNTLEESRRGTQALKTYLAKLLCDHIQANFPSILSTIRLRQQSTEKDLESLGKPRETLEQKRVYLTGIAQKFHSLASQPLLGRYDSNITEDLRIRRMVREANDSFSEDMEMHGHLVPFEDIPKYTYNPNMSEYEEEEEEEEEEEGDEAEEEATHNNKSRLSPETAARPSVSDLEPETSSNESSESDSEYKPGSETFEHRPGDIYRWIRREVDANRGTELQGTLNPDILPVLFHKQVSSWGSLAKTHFTNVRALVIRVIRELNKEACGDEHTREKIMTILRSAREQLKSEGLGWLEKRFGEIRSRHLQTNNPAFEEEVREARLLRFRGALERYRRWKNTASGTEDSSSLLTIDLNDTTALFAELHMSNSQNLEHEIHDILKSYYDVALNDFVTFVNEQIIEHYLSDDKGPLLIFSALYVGGLDDRTIESLASEDESKVQQRASKTETLARYGRAEKIAMKYL